MATPAFDSTVLTRRGVLAAAAGSLLLAGCAPQGQRPDDGPSSSAPSDQDLIVGASLELTGAGSLLGVAQRQALQLTADSLNRTGLPVGNLVRSVRLQILDNGSNPEVAARHAAEFTRAGAQALIGGVLGETSVALAAAAQRVKTPFLSLGYGDRIALPLDERTFTYKLTPDAVDMARRLVELFESKKIRRVSVLAADGMHGDSGVRAMREALADSSTDLARTVRLPATGRRFRTAAERVAGGQRDGVVVWATAPDSGVAARELRAAGHRGPIFFDAGAVADDTVQGANAAAVEGAYAVHPACLDVSAATATTTAQLARRDFVNRYTQRHGVSPNFAPYASDALQLLATSARMATSLDRGRLRALLQAQTVEGIAGGYAFRADRHGGMEPDSLAVYQVFRGNWTRYA
ncbi:ABC transporter substrate-binding protein [Micromonospora aurantiaca]|uniref:ABC transporter substrate-binding protein n=1 Tax=Micromonospora aurantiaca (nom. illeg.) TaxID=47850 RepID=A0ABQ6UDL5_9ACTN|nr:MULTISPECIES: ABC transporter substrate-binding protein [Micromonospora]ADU06575.1 Extracellular ligand-binding receptor [Micromonospora sp. L5]KAB1109326.1 ABC transporter substrate-binding protein [Micromonospora aurantiaca]RNI06081.1 ABC transporter substrate-binding protein [Micromonospora aurantiaca]UFN95371.1 ABC transporter substrate-binding protein [Micromonospora aurantiaca]